MRKTYNEMIAIAGNRTSALGIVPREGLSFKLYPGRFAEALIKGERLSLFASSSSLEYVRSALTKDLTLVETPIGLGPGKWYLAIECGKLKLFGDGPWIGECLPKRAYSKPSPPPSRSFFYVLEAAINATRAFMSERYCEKALELLKFVEEYGDEEDLETAEKIKDYLAEKCPQP